MPILDELAKAKAVKQPWQIDRVTNAAPLLAAWPFIESTHEFHHIYEAIAGVTGPGFVDLSAGLPAVGADTELGRASLLKAGGVISVDEDKARAFGGYAKYFASKLPAILRQAGMDIEKQIIYNTFRQNAIDNGLVIDAGGTGSSLRSILCVKLMEGENCGLYSPLSWQKGAFFSLEPVNGGQRHAISTDSSGNAVYGYAATLQNYLGWLIAEGTEHCAAIVNIDASNAPTLENIEAIMEYVRYDGATAFMCHPGAVKYFRDLKADGLSYTPADKGIDTRVEAVNGVPIRTSWNFQAAETAVEV